MPSTGARTPCWRAAPGAHGCTAVRSTFGRAATALAPLVAAGRGVPRGPGLPVPWWPHGDQAMLELLMLDPWAYVSKGCRIALGNVYRRPTSENLSTYRAETHPILGRLITGGPLTLAGEAQERGLHALRADHTDRCHLCQEARAALKRVYPDWLARDQHYAA